MFSIQPFQMRALSRLGKLGIASVASIVLAACGGGGGGTVAGGGDGTLRVALTDAPSCGYDHVFVTVEKVRVHQSDVAADADGGWQEIVLSPARRIDLLTLTNGVLDELGSTPLPSGRYSQIRLVLADNSPAGPSANAVQPTGSAETPLKTPSAQQSGLKLKANFDVAAGQTSDLVLDFDACKSIVAAGKSGQYILKPVMAVLPRITTTIEGYVTTTVAGVSVSAQRNGVPMRATVPDAAGRFVLSLLPDGTYTVVVTSASRATAVVDQVPVSTTIGRTVINGTATSIAPPASAVRNASGTATYVVGSTPTALTDTSVRALQALSGGLAIEVLARPVDGEDATFSLALPNAAPVKSVYAGSATLVFAPDATAAGKYTLEASAPGRTPLTAAIDLTSADALVQFNFGP